MSTEMIKACDLQTGNFIRVAMPRMGESLVVQIGSIHEGPGNKLRLYFNNKNVRPRSTTKKHRFQLVNHGPESDSVLADFLDQDTRDVDDSFARRLEDELGFDPAVRMTGDVDDPDPQIFGHDQETLEEFSRDEVLSIAAERGMKINTKTTKKAAVEFILIDQGQK